LAEVPTQAMLLERFAHIRYAGSRKHKRQPHLFGLATFNGQRGDATLCDEHAGWRPQDMSREPILLARARAAALIGTLIWTVDDTGWIYELQETNAAQYEYHGYPLLPSDVFAEKIHRRFAGWAAAHGAPLDRQAEFACRMRYGLKP
jgi:hypothetical protein